MEQQKLFKAGQLYRLIALSDRPWKLFMLLPPQSGVPQMWDCLILDHQKAEREYSNIYFDIGEDYILSFIQEYKKLC